MTAVLPLESQSLRVEGDTERVATRRCQVCGAYSWAIARRNARSAAPPCAIGWPWEGRPLERDDLRVFVCDRRVTIEFRGESRGQRELLLRSFHGYRCCARP